MPEGLSAINFATLYLLFGKHSKGAWHVDLIVLKGEDHLRVKGTQLCYLHVSCRLRREKDLRHKLSTKTWLLLEASALRWGQELVQGRELPLLLRRLHKGTSVMASTALRMSRSHLRLKFL